MLPSPPDQALLVVTQGATDQYGGVLATPPHDLYPEGDDPAVASAAMCRL